MPEEIEQIMREIHILFAKAEKLPENRNRIIVDKEVVFGLLERLSHEIYEAMDRFEETKVSRQRAKRKREEEEKEALERVSKNAEEIYAASILYSDDTLDELKKKIENAEETLKHTYNQIEQQMKGYLSYIEENKKELHDQLEQMSQRRIYLQILEEKNKIKAEAEVSKSMTEEKKKENIVGDLKDLGEEERLIEEKKEIPIIEKETAVAITEEKETGYVDDEAKKVEIVIKTADNIEQKIEEVRQARSANLYDMQQAKGKRKNNASSVSEQKNETEVVEQEGEIGEGGAYFRAEDFDLDAEYFAWAEGKGLKKENLEVNSKKGLRDLFKRNKQRL